MANEKLLAMLQYEAQGRNRHIQIMSNVLNRMVQDNISMRQSTDANNRLNVETNKWKAVKTQTEKSNGYFIFKGIMKDATIENDKQKALDQYKILEDPNSSPEKISLAYSLLSQMGAKIQYDISNKRIKSKDIDTNPKKEIVNSVSNPRRNIKDLNENYMWETKYGGIRGN